ncbi:MAG: hypothetical protein ACLQVX_19895 [Limisphaerales bacterium]
MSAPNQVVLDGFVRFYDFAEINRAIADSKRGRTVKPVLLISEQ